jgi:hypothetical protein
MRPAKSSRRFAGRLPRIGFQTKATTALDQRLTGTLSEEYGMDSLRKVIVKSKSCLREALGSCREKILQRFRSSSEYIGLPFTVKIS